MLQAGDLRQYLLKLDADPKVHVLDLWGDFTNPGGLLKAAAFADGRLHLSLADYELLAGKLKPLVDRLIGKE